MEEAQIERLVGEPARLSLEDIVSHPRLAEAREVFLDRFLALYSGDPYTVRLLIESGRFLVYHIAGVLDAGVDPARRETWLTITRLKQEMSLFGLASDRHIDDLIAPAQADRHARRDVFRREMANIAFYGLSVDGADRLRWWARPYRVSVHGVPGQA